MKKRVTVVSLLILAVLALLALSAYGQVTGCCLNPCAPVQFSCSFDAPVTLEQCCGEIANPHVCDGGPQTSECFDPSEGYFIEGGDCAAVTECTVAGCCCSKSNQFTSKASCPNSDDPTNFIEQSDPSANCEAICASASVGGAPTDACNDPAKLAKNIDTVTTYHHPGENKVTIEWAPTQFGCQPYILEIFRRCGVSGTEAESNPAQNLCPPEQFGVDLPIQTYFYPSDTSFIDTDSTIAYGMNYTYTVRATYLFDNVGVETAAGPFEAQGSIVLGDIECDGQAPDAQFCVYENFYNQYDDYLLATLGLPGPSVDAFKTSRSSSRVNKAFHCSNANALQVDLSCSEDQFCVAAAGTASCISGEGECESGGQPFGMFHTPSECASAGFCYYDENTRTTAPGCYSCVVEDTDQRVNCNDYKSQSACEQDACNSGPLKGGLCEWRFINEELGVGVCKNTQDDNCALCDPKENGGFSELNGDNKGAVNQVFEACTQEKADVLNGWEQQCMYNPNTGTMDSCEDVVCSDLSEADCGTTTLGANNVLSSTPSAECGIVGCHPVGSGVCAKDTDGRLGSGGVRQADCLIYGAVGTDAYRQCERDYFPPRTSPLLFEGPLGNAEALLLTIHDQFSLGTPEFTIFNPTGYTTYFCIAPASSAPCTVNVDSPSVSDVFVDEAGQPLLHFADDILVYSFDTAVIRDIASGANRMRLFTEDPNRNLEVVQDITFNLLEGVSTPVGQIEVLGAKKHNNVFFTTESQPILEVTFTKVDSIRSAKLYLGPNELPLTNIVPLNDPDGNGVGFVAQYQPSNPLGDGQYRVVVKGEITNGAIGTATADFKVDTTPPIVETVVPAHESRVETNPIQFNIKFQHLEPVNITYIKMNIDEFDPTRMFDVRDLFFPIAGEFSGEFGTELPAELIGDGRKFVQFGAHDVAGNVLEFYEYYFDLQTHVPKVFMIFPKFGVVSEKPFKLEVGTTSMAECKFSNDFPRNFENSEAFDEGEGVESYFHTKDGYTFAGDSTKLHIECRDSFGTNKTRLTLEYDPTPPVIISAAAVPEEVIEYSDLSNLSVKTQLFVSTDDLTRCKFSTNPDEEFDAMKDTFPEFEDAVFKKTHLMDIVLPDYQETYNYYVICQNKAFLNSTKETITFLVDTSLPLKILDHEEPTVSNTSDVYFSVDTNKVSVCTLDIDGLGAIGMSTLDGYFHESLFNFPVDGPHTIEYVCDFGGEGHEFFPEQATASGEFLIDTTPPTIPEVELRGETDPNFPGIVFDWRTQSIEVKFNSTDPGDYYDSNLLQNANEFNFEYTVYNSFSGEVVVNKTKSTKNNKFILITKDHNNKRLNLSPDERYFVEVFASDWVGNLQPTPGRSLDLEIDPSRKPTHCSDGIKNEGETDVDCGGTCAACDIGGECQQNTDCFSNYCGLGDNSSEKQCLVPSCDDGVRNGDESGIDCGGSCANNCGGGGGCFSNADCSSAHVCNPLTGVCEESTDSCVNGIHDPNEAYIDCGGVCANGCDFGDNCFGDSDCKSGTCTNNQCEGIVDEVFSCNNGVLDEGESDVDCGGTCLYVCGVTTDDGDPICEGDYDCDGFLDEVESTHGTDPNDPQSFPEGVDPLEGRSEEEVTALKNMDTDSDGISDYDELHGTFGYKTNPSNADTDGDGYSDYEEIREGSSPVDPESVPGPAQSTTTNTPAQSSNACNDSDNDGLCYDEEISYGTDPELYDTDGDGYNDGEEIQLGYDPLDSGNHPGGSSWSWLLLLIAIVIIISGVGYFGYTQYMMPEAKTSAPPLTPFGTRKPAPKKPGIRDSLAARLAESKKSKRQGRGNLFPKAGDKRKRVLTTRPAAPKIAKPKKESGEHEDISALRGLDKRKQAEKKDVFDKLGTMHEKPKEEKPPTKRDKKDALKDLSKVADSKKGKKKKK